MGLWWQQLWLVMLGAACALLAALLLAHWLSDIPVGHSSDVD